MKGKRKEDEEGTKRKGK